jgi:hypothetical protein
VDVWKIVPEFPSIRLDVEKLECVDDAEGLCSVCYTLEDPVLERAVPSASVIDQVVGQRVSELPNSSNGFLKLL